jgi:hypothetical protein
VCRKARLYGSYQLYKGTPASVASGTMQSPGYPPSLHSPRRCNNWGGGGARRWLHQPDNVREELHTSRGSRLPSCFRKSKVFFGLASEEPWHYYSYLSQVSFSCNVILLLNQRWTPPIRLQVSDCFRPSVTIVLAPMNNPAGVTQHFIFRIRWISILNFSYFNLFSVSFWITFLTDCSLLLHISTSKFHHSCF